MVLMLSSTLVSGVVHSRAGIIKGHHSMRHQQALTFNIRDHIRMDENIPSHFPYEIADC